MSNYTAQAKNPVTGMIEQAEFLDDHFGRHRYGVRFSDGNVYPESDVEVFFRLHAAAPALLASCKELIQAMKEYERSADDPPTPEHRDMMLRAIKAVRNATVGK